LNALAWVEDKSTDWLFSFTNICDLLGFDPDYMRGVLLKRESKGLKPPRATLVSYDAVSVQP